MRIWTWKDVVTAKLNVVFQNASEITEEYRRKRDTTESNVVENWQASSQVQEGRCLATAQVNF
jgi:hypothetical protein